MADFRVSRRSVSGFGDDALCWAVVEPLWPDGSRLDKIEHVSQGTAGQQAIYYTMLFAREVDNGGLRQFFSNSAGDYWPAVEKGLDMLAAEEHLAALETVLRHFPGGQPPRQRSDRQMMISSFSEADIDDVTKAEERMYWLGGFERRLVPFWKGYIDRNPAEFFL